MLFAKLLDPKWNLFWALFHIGMGIACVFTPWVLIIWFYIIFSIHFLRGIRELGKGRFFYFLSLMFYLISFELLDRMAKTSPFIPYEVGKYFMLLTVLVSLLFYGKKNNLAIIMAFLLVPALFYDLSGKRQIFDFINNFFAPFAAAIGIAVFYKRKISEEQMAGIFRMIWLTCLAALIYSFIKTPDFGEIDFELNANFETTGGAASNQVSTLFGMGMFLTFYAVINRLRFSGFLVTDILILFAFAFQGLLSFSRGGMLIGLLCMLIYYFFVFSGGKSRLNPKSILVLLLVAVAGFAAFRVADQITGGKLLLRYKGETKGTLLGAKDKTLDVITSGRLSIFTEDIILWQRNPIFGVGVGSSSYLRFKTKRVAAHVEFSRLMSEHGTLGLFYFILLLIVYFNLWKDPFFRPNRNLLLALFVMAFVTTFHAAMRTFVSPMFFILAVLQITPVVGAKKQIK